MKEIKSTSSSSSISTTEEENPNHNNIPMEEQVEDMPNDPNLDPLEWTVRKTISIPKKYYWESPENYNVSAKVKLWHRTVQVLGKGLHATEAVGGFFSNILGLNSSRLSYVTDFMTEEEWELAHQNAQEAQGKRELIQEIQENQEMHRV